MSTRSAFIREARPLLVPVPIPGGGELAVTAQPEAVQSCRWHGTGKTLVRVGGVLFEAVVTVAVRIPGSTKWGS